MSQPQWTNTAAARPVVVEDHTGSSSSAGADELLEPYSTLDEPVRETVMRDVRAVGVKLRAVMMPLDRRVSPRPPRMKVHREVGEPMHPADLLAQMRGNLKSEAIQAVALCRSTLSAHNERNSKICSLANNATNMRRVYSLQKPFGYVGVLQEDNVEPSDEQRNVLNQLRDWDLW